MCYWVNKNRWRIRPRGKRQSAFHVETEIFCSSGRFSISGITRNYCSTCFHHPFISDGRWVFFYYDVANSRRIFGMNSHRTSPGSCLVSFQARDETHNRKKNLASASSPVYHPKMNGGNKTAGYDERKEDRTYERNVWPVINVSVVTLTLPADNWLGNESTRLPSRSACCLLSAI